MDVDQITKLVGSVGLPGFIIVFLMVKGVPAVSEFSKQISALTNEVRRLISKVEKYLEK
jgi:hypothetical protein